MCEYCEGECQTEIIKVRSKIEQTDIYIDFTSDGEPILAMEAMLDGCSAYHFAEIGYCPHVRARPERGRQWLGSTSPAL